jgi:hypothetical protein
MHRRFHHLLLVTVLAITALSATALGGQTEDDEACAVPDGAARYTEDWNDAAVLLWDRRYLPADSDDSIFAETGSTPDRELALIRICLDGHGLLGEADDAAGSTGPWDEAYHFYLQEGDLTVTVTGSAGVARFTGPTASGDIPRGTPQTVSETEAFYAEGVDGMVIENDSPQPAFFLLEQIVDIGPPACSSRCL